MVNRLCLIFDDVAWILWRSVPRIAETVRPIMWPTHRALIDRYEEKTTNDEGDRDG